MATRTTLRTTYGTEGKCEIIVTETEKRLQTIQHGFASYIRTALFDIQYLLFLYFRAASTSYVQVSPKYFEKKGEQEVPKILIKTRKNSAALRRNSELQKFTKMRVIKKVN